MLPGMLAEDYKGFKVLAVHCHDQAEAPAKPSAEWCLEWLATVRGAR